MKKNIFIILFYLLNLFSLFGREIHFDYNYHGYDKYCIQNTIKITNKTKEDVSFTIYGRENYFNNDPFNKIIEISVPKSKKNYSIDTNFENSKKIYDYLIIKTDNEMVTFEVSNKYIILRDEYELNIIITEIPTFEQIQKYPRFSYGEADTITVIISDNISYTFNCMYFNCAKNNYSEIFHRYVCFYDYELGKGEIGSPDYIKYKYTLICMPCFTNEDWLAINEKGKQLYYLNQEQKKRLNENIELNVDDLSYHTADYPRIAIFSHADIVGKKYIADQLQYYEVSNMGNDNYDIRGTYSRAVFHCPSGITHFGMGDFQRIITYLGNIEVVRNDGVVLSVPYYECSDKLTELDYDIETLIKRNGDWQREISLTEDVRLILNK